MSCVQEATTQEEMFDNVARPLVRSFMEGTSVTLFAYGQVRKGREGQVSLVSSLNSSSVFVNLLCLMIERPCVSYCCSSPHIVDSIATAFTSLSTYLIVC
jgi:hypothetical protein